MVDGQPVPEGTPGASRDRFRGLPALRAEYQPRRDPRHTREGCPEGLSRRLAPVTSRAARHSWRTLMAKHAYAVTRQNFLGASAGALAVTSLEVARPRWGGAAPATSEHIVVDMA